MRMKGTWRLDFGSVTNGEQLFYFDADLDPNFYLIQIYIFITVTRICKHRLTGLLRFQGELSRLQGEPP